ncbi:MAG: GNAT family N-acetyltransferase [Pseudomonadota bacterium]
MSGPLPTLETPRLRLRPRRMRDLEACLAMDRETGTLDFVDWPEDAGSWQDEAAHRAFIRKRIKGPYPPGHGYWIIQKPGDPAFLGWVLLIPKDARGPEIEIGWRVPIAHRGYGYAPEAASRLLAYAFADLGLSQMVADIYPENTASCRVAEKIGMKPTGLTPTNPGTQRYCARIDCRR